MSLADHLRRLGGPLSGDIERFVEAGVAELKEHAAELEQHVEEHPQHLFALLRAVRPVLVIHDVAIVTRYRDVIEVLSDDEAFSVDPYAGKMRALAGEFILGLDDCAEYERAVSILRLAAPRSDIPALAAFVREGAEDLVAQSASTGQLDVADLAKRVPARLAARWLGTPGPDEDAMITWTLAMFEDIFVNLKNDAQIHATAESASQQLRPYLSGLLAERKRAAGVAGALSGAAAEPARAGAIAGAAPPEDVLGRLIDMQATSPGAFSDAEIVTNLIGLLVGFIPTVATATTFALDALLDRPDALAAAQSAARADEGDAVRAHVWEAMRLAPQGPGLLRRARRDVVVGEGTHHETRVAAGTAVFAATQSAMLDGAVLDDPEDFRAGRPANHYLHFGAGLHECFGRFANAMQIPLIAQAVLRREGLARAPGDAGKLVKAGPYPKSLLVTFDH